MKTHSIVPQFERYGLFLRHVRLSRHMSLTEVCTASQLGADPTTRIALPTLSKIESGKVVEPSMRTLVKVARGYGVQLGDLAYFFGDVSCCESAVSPRISPDDWRGCPARQGCRFKINRI